MAGSGNECAAEHPDATQAKALAPAVPAVSGGGGGGGGRKAVASDSPTGSSGGLPHGMGRTHKGDGPTPGASVAAADPQQTAVTAALTTWRGPLEFAAASEERAFIEWACHTWQMPLDIAAGSLCLHHIIALAVPNRDGHMRCSLLDGGVLAALSRMWLAELLLAGLWLVLQRRSRYVQYREALVAGARLLCYVIAAATAEERWPPTAGWRQFASPAAAVLPFVAQVRFWRHVPLAAAQLVITAAFAGASGGFTWRGGIPVELRHAAAFAVAPATALYLLESVARRAFVASQQQRPAAPDAADGGAASDAMRKAAPLTSKSTLRLCPENDAQLDV